MDEDGSGTITFKEFLEVMTAKVGEQSSREELARVFKLFDGSHVDQITLDDIRKVSREVGDSLSDEELKDILTRCDVDKNGQLTFEDFYTVITAKLH